MKAYSVLVLSLLLGRCADSQEMTISLKQALERARQFSTQIQAAGIASELAKEDRAQAIAASLPSAGALNQFIYTEGNGTASGVFVANDGVHVYNEQLTLHEDALSLVRRGEIRAARAAEAVARAKADIAARGLNTTVIQNYYAIASAERKLRNAQTSNNEAAEFLDISQKQERGGEAAHADVIKAQLQRKQRVRDLQEAQLGLDKAKVALAVLIFPTLQRNFEIVDDLDQLPALGSVEELGAQTKANSADLQAARASTVAAKAALSVARYAYLPSLALDFFYGIDANQFAATTDYPTYESGRSTQPAYLVPYRHNLGYSGQITLNVPLWNWGATHSKVKQAALREKQAELDLDVTQRHVEASIYSSYKEAQTALAEVTSLRESTELAAESLRLTLLRYRAGEASALEVVDAQTTASAARDAYVDGLLRYRVGFAALQALTGNF